MPLHSKRQDHMATVEDLARLQSRAHGQGLGSKASVLSLLGLRGSVMPLHFKRQDHMAILEVQARLLP